MDSKTTYLIVLSVIFVISLVIHFYHVRWLDKELKNMRKLHKDRLAELKAESWKNQQELERMAKSFQTHCRYPTNKKTNDFLEETWLLEHKGLNGERCPNLKHSYSAFTYHIKTLQGAVAIAQRIANDHGECLKSGRRHSLACGNGRSCAEIRLVRSKALAEYILDQKR